MRPALATPKAGTETQGVVRRPSDPVPMAVSTALSSGVSSEQSDVRYMRMGREPQAESVCRLPCCCCAALPSRKAPPPWNGEAVNNSLKRVKSMVVLARKAGSEVMSSSSCSAALTLNSIPPASSDAIAWSSPVYRKGAGRSTGKVPLVPSPSRYASPVPTLSTSGAFCTPPDDAAFSTLAVGRYSGTGVCTSTGQRSGLVVGQKARFLSSE